jgi:hypothetical protein
MSLPVLDRRAQLSRDLWWGQVGCALRGPAYYFGHQPEDGRKKENVAQAGGRRAGGGGRQERKKERRISGWRITAFLSARHVYAVKVQFELCRRT